MTWCGAKPWGAQHHLQQPLGGCGNTESKNPNSIHSDFIACLGRRELCWSAPEVLHYWTRPLCRGSKALDKGQKTLGKGFTDGGPRQRALGKF